MTLFRWTPEHVAGIGHGAQPVAPVFDRTDAPPVLDGLDLWDHWPVLTSDGALAPIRDGLLVVALAAPVFPDPEQRHAFARLRLLHRAGERWTDLGWLLPDGFSPGSREWAGSTVFEAATGRLTLFFTAAGERDEADISFTQRLFSCETMLDDQVRPMAWSGLHELVRPDGVIYETALEGGGGIGTIKAFRDPFLFREPGGADVLLFAASRANAASDWNGVIGTARRRGDVWVLGEPWVDATGVNNELERPHAVTHAGHTYLFWSTQRKVFAPELRQAPTGLYGLVADGPDAPWRPINGTGLVFANPEIAPAQAYSWQVLPDLSVWSFADLVGHRGVPATPADARQSFAGAPAPVLRLSLVDDRATLTN